MAGDLRQRADLHLLGQLLAGQRSADDDSPRRFRMSLENRAARFGAHVDALCAVGALTHSEGAAWTSRFALEGCARVPAPVPRPAAGTPEAARELLEELLTPSARGRGTGTMRRDSSAFERALDRKSVV